MFKLWSGGLAWGMQKSTEVKNETLHSVNALRNEHISVDTHLSYCTGWIFKRMITQVKVPEQHFSNMQANMILINWMKNNTIFHPESSNLHTTALAILFFIYIFFLQKADKKNCLKMEGYGILQIINSLL